MGGVFCAILGYFVGCVNPAYLIAKKNGFDIREAGSGNAGGSNAVITMGKKIGFVCCLFDFLKAFIVVKMIKWLLPGSALAIAVTIASCILGHVFPFYMKFRGGKGLACLGGSILAYNWKVFIIMLIGEIVFVLIIDYIAFVSMTGSAVFSVVFGVMEKSLFSFLILAAICLVICWRHFENMKRIANGTELKLSFMWNHDKEKARVEENLGEEIIHLSE